MSSMYTHTYYLVTLLKIDTKGTYNGLIVALASLTLKRQRGFDCKSLVEILNMWEGKFMLTFYSLTEFKAKGEISKIKPNEMY